jgi:hypothetical protein
MMLRFAVGRIVAVAGLSTLVAACHDSTSGSREPRSIVIVSGNDQTGSPSVALDSSLVVQVLDGSGRGVAGTPLDWSARGGGSLSTTATTTDNQGKSSVTWTLAPAIGDQVVTVTSSAIGGASAAFVASNGPTISGTVTINTTGSAFAPTFSRRTSTGRLSNASPMLAASPRVLRSATAIVVGFRSDVVGVAAAGSAAYRSLSTARAASTTLRARLDAVLAGRAVRDVRVSPALLAARLSFADSAEAAIAMRALAADPAVAWVEHEARLSIRTRAPRAVVAERAVLGGGSREVDAASVATRLPNDGGYYLQSWSSNMIDLPRAWAITTGSASVTVAVIDMGVQFSHPTMGNLTTDGYDFVTPLTLTTPEPFCDGSGNLVSTDGDGDGPDPDPTDPDDLEFDPNLQCWFHSTAGDHGLWTAGIIGAVGNQGIGMAGVNWTVKMRPIRVLDITGGGDYFDIAQGVLYAAGLPAVGAGGAMVQTTRAPIINMSLGGYGSDTVLASAVAAAVNAGSLIVASSGNDGVDDQYPAYPASYPGVMAVAAVGMDGVLATYSNAGTRVSVAAPGGDFRLDDNGGGGVLGPGWNFVTGRPNLIFGYGTSAAAPFVSGIAALLLAQTPSLTAAQLRSRIESFATRPPNSSRSDSYGWGIVNAYNALMQRNGPARSTMLRLVNATTGGIVASTKADANGNFAFARLTDGAYFVQAGEDEDGDGVIGTVGRRFAWAGGFGSPTVFNVPGNAKTTAINLGLPVEVEPNDDATHANALSINGYVIGSVSPPDAQDVYAVSIPLAGNYVFETSGVTGTCGWGIEVDTFMSISNANGTLVGVSDNFTSATSSACSRISQSLQAGVYYVTIVGTAANGLSPHGRYRLSVRAGG